MNEEQLEGTIMDKKLNAPRITPEHIDSCIKSTDYYVLPDTTITICNIKLINGFSVIGKSACVDPKNFDKEIGEDIAFEDAKSQIWVLEGYLLQQRLHDE